MPKVSKDITDRVVDFGVAEDRSSDLDGYTVNFVTIKQTHDLAPMLAGLPGGNCSCPHWGYVFKGRMWFRSPDGEESFGSGDAFYVEPGHTSGADAGTEFVVFSPSEVMADVESHMMQRARQGVALARER